MSLEKDCLPYIKKGLLCPFCNEDVYFRKGFNKQYSDRSIEIKGYFVHHPDSKNADSCEALGQSEEGKKILDDIQKDNFNIRLNFYSNHLWIIYKNAYQVDNKEINATKKTIIGNSIITAIDIFRKILSDSDTLTTILDQTFLMPETPIRRGMSYAFNGHKVMLEEIIEYLISDQGKHIFKKILLHSSHLRNIDTPTLIKLADILTIKHITIIFVHSLFRINWLKAINQEKDKYSLLEIDYHRSDYSELDIEVSIE